MPQSDNEYFTRVADALQSPYPPAAPFSLEGGDAHVKAGLLIYRNNIRSSLSRALGEIFPVVKALVGEDFFKRLALDYFHGHPPSSPIIARYGDALPTFLADYAPARSLPYLACVARLELARLNAYHAADAPALTPDEIAQAAEPAGFESLRLTLHPSLHLVSSNYAVGAIWRKHQGKGAGKIDASTPECVLVIRQDGDVMVETVGRPLFESFRSLQRGETLGGAIECALSCDAGFNPQSLFEKLFATKAVIAATNGQRK